MLFLESLGALATRKLGTLEFIAWAREKFGAGAPRSSCDNVERDGLDYYLREHHGHFWRHKVRLLLVAGEPDQINAIAPHLKDKKWLAGHDTILLWGGSTQTKFDDGRVTPWQGLSRWRALDGVIWALNAQQSTDTEAMDNGVRHLQDLARQLRWQLPLHLWQVCDSGWDQDKRPTQAVGCLLPSDVTPQALESGLESLVLPLRDNGWAQIQGTMRHDFLLRLSRDLQVEGIARWRQALAPLFRVFARSLPLRGLWFSLPLPGSKDTEVKKAHLWYAMPPWDGVLGDKTVLHRRLGWGVTRVGYSLALGLALIWSAGMLLSFATNRVHIAQVQTSLATLQQSSTPDEQFLALNDLARELGRLEYRATHGTPWYQRFGLNKNPELLQMLWPTYVEANQRLLRDPAMASLQQQLTTLTKLPADSPERLKRAPQAYEQLKAYLMLARPEKADAAFLVKVLGPL
ncbi:ImcF-related family protein, partial [Pseudomonas sp. IT-P218]|uniref:ImcF-related family protein n=1 Tax=Pseudomonas sp. IT-P218 TaxID=3026449 RepID=UPI0039DFB099